MFLFFSFFHLLFFSIGLMKILKKLYVLILIVSFVFSNWRFFFCSSLIWCVWIIGILKWIFRLIFALVIFSRLLSSFTVSHLIFWLLLEIWIGGCVDIWTFKSKFLKYYFENYSVLGLVLWCCNSGGGLEIYPAEFKI